MKLVLLFAALVTLSFSLPSGGNQWTSFKLQYGKSYKSQSDELYRRFIFLKNVKMIEEHNAKYAAGLVSYSMKLNKFADLLPKELNGLKKTRQLINHEFTGLAQHLPASMDLPESVDWRKNGAVTPVKKQGGCASCWAFSVTGTLEGQLFRKTGRLVSLSEQQLVDCSLNQFQNFGCVGGIMDNAYMYIMLTGGIASEESYPYLAKDGSCRFKLEEAVNGTVVKSYVELPKGNLSALQVAVATVGPISVAINDNDPGFMFYHGGIFDSETCDSETLTHAVLVVGYGTENGKDYWIVKNSNGPHWGEEGYVRMARNKNLCGIASWATYPVL